MKQNILYLPIGRKTFDMAAAEEQRVKSLALLNEINISLISPNEIITTLEDLKSFLLTVNNENISLIIYQSLTFADGEFIHEIVNKVDAHVLVWSVREPSVGGRLRLNSLTGGNSTGHYLRSINHSFSFVFGNADERETQMKIRENILVSNVIQNMSELKIGVVGDYPPGFFFSDTDETLLAEITGVKVERLDLELAFKKSLEIPKEEWIDMVETAEKHVVGLKRTDQTVKRFAQFSTYIDKEIKERGIKSLAIRCWPEFFNELGAAACSTLSHFTEYGVTSSCESDIHGVISMFILRQLSGEEAPYLGDMVHVEEESNSAVFWHCGAGAYSLAHPDTGAQAGIHPNRQLGFTMEFGLKPGIVTLFRLSFNKHEGYRLLILRGRALDKPQIFHGTSVEVEFETDVRETLDHLIYGGFEPHYALVYADIVEELKELGRRLKMTTTIFTNGMRKVE